MNASWQQANLSNWNNRAALHMRDATGFYDVAAFLAGRDTLCPIEAPEIGDIRGKSLLHLQCHFGLDTLSLARRGAHVTGLDFSPVAIEGARELAAKAGLPATFVQSDLYEASKAIARARSTGSIRAGARSAGCRTSAPRRKWWRTCSPPAARSIRGSHPFARCSTSATARSGRPMAGAPRRTGRTPSRTPNPIRVTTSPSPSPTTTGSIPSRTSSRASSRRA